MSNRVRQHWSSVGVDVTPLWLSLCYFSYFKRRLAEITKWEVQLFSWPVVLAIAVISHLYSHALEWRCSARQRLKDAWPWRPQYKEVPYALRTTSSHSLLTAANTSVPHLNTLIYMTSTEPGQVCDPTNPTLKLQATEKKYTPQTSCRHQKPAANTTNQLASP